MRRLVLAGGAALIVGATALHPGIPAATPLPAPVRAVRPEPAWTGIHVETRTGCRYATLEGRTKRLRLDCRKPDRRKTATGPTPHRTPSP